MGATGLKDLTKRYMGDFAPQLLAIGAVVPIVITKNGKKQPIAKWKQPIDPDYPWVFDALAIKTGAPSGITVIDYDDRVPDDPNVITSRGGHIYVEWDGDRNRQRVGGAAVDIRGSGGIAVFYSPYHQVRSLDLHRRQEYSDLLDTHSSYLPRVSNNTRNLEKENVWEYCSPEQYRAKVHGAGYKIDVLWAGKALASQVANAVPGTRHDRFLKNLCAGYLIGADLDAIVSAAYQCGLEEAEVEATLRSVRRNPVGIDIFDMAYAWRERAERVKSSPVAELLSKAAIEQHSMNPLFNQERAFAQCQNEISLSTFRRDLKRYCDSGMLKKKENGRQPSGNLYPNNYQMMLPEGTE